MHDSHAVHVPDASYQLVSVELYQDIRSPLIKLAEVLLYPMHSLWHKVHHYVQVHFISSFILGEECML